MKQLTTLLVLITAFFIDPVTIRADELADIKADLVALLNRVEALEAENKALRTATAKGNWSDKVSIKGDLRYRYEDIDVEGSNGRERSRVRARISAKAELPKDVELGIGFATGGSDPTSTNQTLGSGGTSKGTVLDFAYFSWNSHPGVNIIGGKFKNVFFKPEKHGLLWDGDYNPEGLAVTYDNGSLFLNAALNWLESDSKNASTRAMTGLQAGYVASINDATLTFGAGFYDFPVKGREVFRGDDDDFFGNSFTCADPATLSGCTYDNDYEELQLFAHLKTRIGDQPFTVFADYVNNSATNDHDTGWAAGLVIGKASNPGTWQFSYTYEDKEADAVFAALTDSDIGGGGTDVKGHIFKGAVSITKSWKLGVTYFDNVDNAHIGTQKDYNRIQFDTAFKF